jgi:DNA (cytosine-5)-methyltransferase 1
VNGLVLSLFPGIGLLDRAFEEEGFCVVRGPDVLWGGDVRTFHPPAGVFEGVMGGPPCQSFTPLANVNRARGREPKFGNLIPEYERCVREARPGWFLMENVRSAPLPEVEGYAVYAQVFNNRWLGEEQNRERRLCFGTPDGRRLRIEVAALESPRLYRAVGRTVGGIKKGQTKVMRGLPAVLAGHGSSEWQREEMGYDYTLPQMCRLQGLPEDFADEMPFTMHGKKKVVGNGVPIPMGRAIARAVERAMAPAERVG